MEIDLHPNTMNKKGGILLTQVMEASHLFLEGIKTGTPLLPTGAANFPAVALKKGYFLTITM